MSEEPAPTYHYNPRGLGLNWIPCFVCGHGGDGQRAQADMAAFVKSKEDGEAIVALLPYAKLDYRDFEPNRVQVKVGACPRHEPNLELLYHLTREKKEISAEIVERAMPRPPRDLTEALEEALDDIKAYRRMVEKEMLAYPDGGYTPIILAVIDRAGYDIVPRS